MKKRRKSTSTSKFGAGRREGHDAASFYARFESPEISRDDVIYRGKLDKLNNLVIKGDSRCMKEIPSDSVALVVTSPPYFVGKEYEESLGQGHVPDSYFSYLELLREVFAECKRTLEPGGRIAVNVANLGRKPYRSLSADVIRILQDDLKMLLRGEIIWKKGRGASGSCAWGSYRSASNPVLRDLTERVIVACKGRFDRAVPIRKRREENLPFENTVTADEFMEATLDVWELNTERAGRVGHPAPFPVELPQRLIELYTYRNDLVLDPFLGSGSAAVAALRSGRRFAGYDIDAGYIDTAKKRIRKEKADLKHVRRIACSDEGKAVHEAARNLLQECGFRKIKRNRKIPGLGVTVSFIAEDETGETWHFIVSGAYTLARSGLQRTDTAYQALGVASILVRNGFAPVVLAAAELPEKKSAADVALHAAGPELLFDVVKITSTLDRAKLKQYAAGDRQKPLAGFWTAEELGCAD